MSNEELYTAYHEAGHVTACFYLNIPIKKEVSIISNEDSFGRMFPSIKVSLFKKLEYDIVTPGMERYFKNIMIMSFAGPAAEAKKRGQQDWSDCGYEKDFSQVAEIVVSFFGHEDVWNAYVTYIAEEAKALVNSDLVWPFIEKLANSLIDKKVITAADCRRLYKQFLLDNVNNYSS